MQKRDGKSLSSFTETTSKNNDWYDSSSSSIPTRNIMELSRTSNEQINNTDANITFLVFLYTSEYTLKYTIVFWLQVENVYSNRKYIGYVRKV